MDETKKVEFRKFVCELRGLSKDLGLTVSHMLLLLAESDLPKTGQVFGQILIAMRRELHDKLFLYVPAERASYWEWDDVLSEKAGAAFSGPYSELREAANCYATERYTGCVFHTMRAVEIGVWELGRDLGVAFPDKPIELAEWQNIVEQIENKIKNKVSRSASDPEQTKNRDDDRKFYSEVATQFRYFKDGWRIRVAHGRETYTGSKALTVFSHAREFFEDLSNRLTESL